MTSRKHRERRKRRRIQLELDEDIKAALKDLSNELGVSQSQLVQFFLMTGLQDVAAGRARLSRYLEPSEAPMWQYKVNFDRLRRDLGD